MEEKNVGIPFVVYEAEMDRQERRNKRLVGVIVLILVCLVVTNLAWLHAWLKYDYVGYQVSSQDGGNANYIGNDGEVYNGISDSSEADPKEEEGR